LRREGERKPHSAGRGEEQGREWTAPALEKMSKKNSLGQKTVSNR
jgi:hypothetical protein